MKHHETFIKRTIEIAEEAKTAGNHPFGAILVFNGEILAEAENKVNSEKDPTQHAELRLVSKSVKTFGISKLAKCTLYTSTEPCAMCCGALYWTGIRKVIFGCTAKRLGELANGNFVVPSRTLFEFTPDKIEIVGPILSDEAEAVHHGFWTF